MLRAISALALCCLLTAAPAYPWGREGHHIVALIAARNLSAAARAKVARILGTNDAGLEKAMLAAATWPDNIDKAKTGTRNWHFVDVPVTAPFDVGTLCASHDCVIDQIADMEDRLLHNRTGFALKAKPRPARPMTSQELAFLIHFVGDIHQPLHAANDGDRGGNCVHLTTSIPHKDFDTKELHAVWDTDEVLAVLKVLGAVAETAEKLFQRFNSGASVSQLTPLDWAHEANDLARKDIYESLQLPNHEAPAGTCAPGIAKIQVTQEYLDGNEADVETQLMRAGVRLSNILNQICAGSGCKAKPGANHNKK